MGRGRALMVTERGGMALVRGKAGRAARGEPGAVSGHC